MKRMIVAGTLALAGFALFYPRPEERPAGVAPANSAPLTERVSRTLRNPSRTPAAATAPLKFEAALAQARVTRDCFQKDSCDYPSDDPHAYAFAVGRDLAAQLGYLRESYGQDAGYRGELETLARELVREDDGYVQAEAIRTFGLYPPSAENLSAMVQGLENTADPLLVRQALGEWRRYVGTRDEPAMVDALAQLVARGGQFSGEAAAEEIRGFLNERTVASFREALGAMVPTSTAAVSLRRALRQYDLETSGG